MKITKVEGLLMSCPFEKPIELPFYGGLRTILKRDAMLIRVSTDTGITGFAPGPGPCPSGTGDRPLDQPFSGRARPEFLAGFRFSGGTRNTENLSRR